MALERTIERTAKKASRVLICGHEDRSLAGMSGEEIAKKLKERRRTNSPAGARDRMLAELQRRDPKAGQRG